MSVCFSIREGPVTVASLAGPVDGEFNFLVCRGTAVLDVPDSGNRARIRLETPARAILDAMIENGMGHHLVVGIGDAEEELRELAALMDFRCVT